MRCWADLGAILVHCVILVCNSFRGFRTSLYNPEIPICIDGPLKKRWASEMPICKEMHDIESKMYRDVRDLEMRGRGKKMSIRHAIQSIQSKRCCANHNSACRDASNGGNHHHSYHRHDVDGDDDDDDVDDDDGDDDDDE